MSYDSLKKECFEANLQLVKRELVIQTFGNVSCCDRPAGVFAIKPSGVDYEELKWRDIVVVDFSGKVAEGMKRPSSDTLTHVVLYNHFPNAGGIVHTHSTYAVAWAQSLRDVPIYGTTHADSLPVDIPCTEPMADDRIENDYETETGLQIAECFRKRNLSPAEVQLVLVGGHGPFAWGANAEKAVCNAEILEELCRMAYLTEQLRPDAVRLKKALIDKHYSRKHGANAYYGQH